MFTYYNMNQVVLPLDFEMKLQENDIAYTVHEMVEQIPEEAFDGFARDTGCPSYHPKMMMKIILCAYTQSVFSGRKIEALLKDSVRMMWLAQGYEPSYRTINRFRVNPLTKELLRQCFVQFRCQLVQEDVIDDEAVFIDGTKLEANANKFTFVWRRMSERYSDQLIEKSNRFYEELLDKEIIPGIERESADELTTEELQTITEQVDETVASYDQKIEESTDTQERKRLRSERKEPKQYRKQFQDMITRKEKYQKDMEIFRGRNSYSKTDHDATFMRMKDDYMRNGQLKPGYNLQLATEGQYSLAYQVFPNPTDTRTLIPFLDHIENHFFDLPAYIVGDAGYGSEPNYEDVRFQRERTPLITYNTYRKEKKKKYKEDPFNVANWPYDKETDTFTCPAGQALRYQYDSRRTDRHGYTRFFKVYECDDCTGCPLRASCTKAKEGNNRKIYYNETWEDHKSYMREKLSEPETKDIYKQRKVDVEPVFGFLKACLCFRRFSVRGTENVENELGFALMAVNLRKYNATIANSASGDWKDRYRKSSDHLFTMIGVFLLRVRVSYVPDSFLCLRIFMYFNKNNIKK
ncbi:DDE transposase [Salimicrobium jeotgali]|uniref:DDE transposase n=1 Tax=Salimicrobium jeotgali TaxID=1230341 RepID=A0AAC8PSX3_9BACI|nr:IS1182 family transposase [Salimicrobium jeotgali]AKG05306.1 DDE transposase [Salimicrobium jeotgali]